MSEGRYLYVAARDLGLTTAELRAHIDAWGTGWDTSHHMRRLTDEQVEETRRRLAPEPEPEAEDGSLKNKAER